MLLAVTDLEGVRHDVLSHCVAIQLLRACWDVVTAWTVRIHSLLVLIQILIPTVSSISFNSPSSLTLLLSARVLIRTNAL